MENRKRMKSIVWMLTVCVMVLFFAQQTEAASTETVTGTCCYDEAYDVLELLNKQRDTNGMQKLTMDKDLLEAAMLRAAECVVVFNHVRPNGEDCFTACKKMYGENIAMGYRSASDVMSAWMNSQGHRMNILNSEYTSVGIGCFNVNGTKYWVQCFGYNDADKVSKPSNCKRTYKVSLTSGKETEVVTSGDSSNPLQSGVADFKVKAGKKKLTLTWKKKSGVNGYQIQISTSKSFKSKQTYTLGKNVTKKTITKYKGSKLKANKKYYVRIRAYTSSKDADGITTKKYSKWNTLNKTTK